LLTVDAVAERLSIPRYAVVAAVRSGDLESVRISERVRRVAPQAVDRFIQARLDSPPVRQVRQVNSNNHGKRGR
jgi:excisionase family DNA binding protein